MGIFWNIQEPLTHFFLNNRAITSPASTRLHLFVSEYSITWIAPVYRSKFLKRKPIFIEFCEEPLIPFVIIWIVAFYHTVPVIRKPHSLDLFGDRGHVFFSNIMRVTTFFYRSIFCRHTKRIKSHWVQNFESHHSLVARNSITDRIVPYVAHMHFPRRIRIHLKAVKRRLVLIYTSNEYFLIIPSLLPIIFINTFDAVTQNITSYPLQAVHIRLPFQTHYSRTQSM